MRPDEVQARDARDEVGDVGVGGGEHDLLWRADLHDDAVAHDGDAIADAHGFFEIVRDEDRGLLHHRREPHELALQLAPDERVERAERLVHEQDVGLGGDGARQAHALLHAARELVREALAPAREFNHGKRFLGRVASRVARHAADLECHRHVVEHAAVRHQAEVLEDHGDAPVAQRAQLGLRQRHDIAAIDKDAARRGFEQAVDVTQERGLARARQAHEAEDLAALDAEAGVVHADHAVEGLQHLRLVQAFALDRGEGLVLARAEDFPHAAHVDGDVGRRLSPLCGIGLGCRGTVALRHCQHCRTAVVVSSSATRRARFVTTPQALCCAALWHTRTGPY